jgi:hypothetical protein
MTNPIRCDATRKPRLCVPGAPSPDAPIPEAKSPQSATDHDSQAAGLFNLETLAKHCACSVKSLTRARAMGLLLEPTLMIGRSPRFSPEAVRRWLLTRPKLPGRTVK